MLAVYLVFEKVVVNFRQVLIGGVSEASHPSSTVVPAMCVMLTAMYPLNGRLRHKPLRRAVLAAFSLFTVFMVIVPALIG